MRLKSSERKAVGALRIHLGPNFADKTWDAAYIPYTTGRVVDFTGAPVGDLLWHNIDVTALTSANAKSVWLRLGISGAGFSLYVRKNGSAVAFGQGGIDSPAAAWISGYVVIGVDANQQFEYKVSNANANIYIDVQGYEEQK